MTHTTELPLTRGKVALIDSDMTEYVHKRQWAYNNTNVVSEDWRDSPASIVLQRYIMNAQRHEHVIHINGDRLDNRRTNLRVVPLSYISAQLGPSRKNTTGYKGVSYCKRAKKYQSNYKIADGKIHLGYHDDPVIAAKLYDMLTFEYYGVNAYFNFPITEGHQRTT